MRARFSFPFSIVIAVAMSVGCGTAPGPPRQEPLPAQVPPPAAAEAVPAVYGTAVPAASPADLTEHENRIIEIFRRASISTVYITSVEYRRDWFPLNVYEIPRGSGSGFVWDDRGHVVTN